MRNPPVFTADYKEDGYFTLWVETISDSAVVRIDVDDKLILSACFTPGNGEKLWKSIKYIEEHNVYQAVYDTVLRIPVTKGRHNITVRNDGLDWMRIRSYQFENIGLKTNRLMDIAGIRKDSDQYFWIKNKDFNWKKVKHSGHPDTVRDAYLIINTLEKGSTYHYELWDTFRGVILLRNTIVVNDQEISIPLPDVAKDIACKFIKITR